MIHALLTLLTCQLIGETIARVLGLPIPGPVLGMVLLLGVLTIRKKISEPLEASATSLLTHLSLLFVPAGVGVMVQFGRIRAEWLPLAASLLVSTVVTIAITGWVFQTVQRRVSPSPQDEEAGDEH